MLLINLLIYLLLIIIQLRNYYYKYILYIYILYITENISKNQTLIILKLRITMNSFIF
jgi:hypothetical protein